MQESISNTYHRGRIPVTSQFQMLLLAMALFTSCTNEEIATRDYPLLNTLEVTYLSKHTLVANAEILSGNPAAITEYGFVWSLFEKLSIDGDDKQSWIGAPGAMKFGDTIQANFQNNVTYQIRSYAKTHNLVVYGNPVTFHTLGSDVPILTGFSPQSGTWGDTIRITGMNFGYMKERVDVKLGYVKAKVLSVTDETIEIIIPPERNIEKVRITVSLSWEKTASDTFFTYLNPVIKSVTPKSATYNDTLFIRGDNFSIDPSFKQYTWYGYQIKTVYASRNLLKFLVPFNLNRDYFTIKVLCPISNTELKEVGTFLENMELYSFDPETVYTDNEIITIKGKNFNPMLNYNKVEIFAVKAEIVELSTTTMKVKLPPGLLPADLETMSTSIRVNSGPKSATFTKPLVVKRK